MKHVLFIVAASIAAFVLGRMVFLSFVSDETKIRWLVEEMEEGYNAGDLSDCVGPLHEDWEHDGHSLTRDYLKGGLFQAFREERDRETGKRTSKVEIDPESFSVVVEDEQARIELEARFSRQKQGVWAETWHIRVFGNLENGEDGWRITRTRHDDLSGTQLSR
jgi:hypothetical protein